MIKPCSSDWLSRYYDYYSVLRPHSIKRNVNDTQIAPESLVTAGCIVYKDAFNAIQGFRPEFTAAAGEDLFLGNIKYMYTIYPLHYLNIRIHFYIHLVYQLRTIGELAYNDDAIINHQFVKNRNKVVGDDIQEFIERFYQYGMGNKILGDLVGNLFNVHETYPPAEATSADALYFNQIYNACYSNHSSDGVEEISTDNLSIIARVCMYRGFKNLPLHSDIL